MEKYVEEGKIRSSGVSCYYIKEIDEFSPNVNMLENISIFDFELSAEEMAQIAELNRNEKHDWY